MKSLIALLKDNFSWKGLIIAFVSLLPSILMAFLPPKNAPDAIKDNLTLSIIENIGRVALIVILLFSKKSFDRKIDVGFGLMCVVWALDSVGWIRYFCFGRTYELLYKSLWFVPIPLAVFPLLAFAFAAVWGRNLPLGIAVVVMSVGHIPNSYILYLQIK